MLSKAEIKKWAVKDYLNTHRDNKNVKESVIRVNRDENVRNGISFNDDIVEEITKDIEQDILNGNIIVSDFKYHSTNNGNCQVHYVTKNKNDETIYFCLQNDGKHAEPQGINFYRCSSDGEASHLVKMPKIRLPFSPNDESTDKEINSFLRSI